MCAHTATFFFLHNFMLDLKYAQPACLILVSWAMNYLLCRNNPGNMMSAQLNGQNILHTHTHRSELNPHVLRLTSRNTKYPEKDA